MVPWNRLAAPLTCLLALLTLAPEAPAQDEYYVWLISDSQTNPLSNFGNPATYRVLYLWFWCDTENGLSGATMDLSVPPGTTVEGFYPMNGFVNAGGATDLLVGDVMCRQGPVVVGHWVTFWDGPGNYCLVPSSWSGKLEAAHCEDAPPYYYPIRQVGFSVGVPEPICYDQIAASLSCMATVGNGESSWGRTKSLYR